MWNLAYDGGYGAGPAVFGLICVRTGYPVGFALTGALILAVVPAAVRQNRRGECSYHGRGAPEQEGPAREAVCFVPRGHASRHGGESDLPSFNVRPF